MEIFDYIKILQNVYPFTFSNFFQTSIVPLSTGEEFEGVFVLSSKNVYIIKFLPLYSEKLEKKYVYLYYSLILG